MFSIIFFILNWSMNKSENINQNYQFIQGPRSSCEEIDFILLAIRPMACIILEIMTKYDLVNVHHMWIL